MLWELIDLSDWKTKSQILKELKRGGIVIDERNLRQKIELQNKLYYNHESDFYIVHSAKGYKVTSDREEILESLKDMRKRALNMLHKEAKTKKALGENMNFKLVIHNNEFMHVEQ